MKKINIILCCFFFVTLVVFVGDGAAQTQPISQSDLPDLKGKWKGERSFAMGPRLNSDLEITNDTLPLECILTFYDVQQSGSGGSRGSSRTETRKFKAKINEKGNLYSKWGNFEMELSLYKSDGKMKLEGDFFWGGAKGTLSVKKK